MSDLARISQLSGWMGYSRHQQPGDGFKERDRAAEPGQAEGRSFAEILKRLNAS